MAEAVEAVTVRSAAPLEVLLVVDHNDALLDRAAMRWGPPVRVMPNEEGRGLSGARNTGVGHAEGDVAVFLDDDAVRRLRACRAAAAGGVRGGGRIGRRQRGRAALPPHHGAPHRGRRATRERHRRPDGPPRVQAHRPAGARRGRPPHGHLSEVISTSALETSWTNGDERHRSELVTLSIKEHPDDFRIATAELPEGLYRPTTREAIALLDREPQLAALNANVTHKAANLRSVALDEGIATSPRAARLPRAAARTARRRPARPAPPASCGS